MEFHNFGTLLGTQPEIMEVHYSPSFWSLEQMNVTIIGTQNRADSQILLNWSNS